MNALSMALLLAGLLALVWAISPGNWEKIVTLFMPYPKDSRRQPVLSRMTYEPEIVDRPKPVEVLEGTKAIKSPPNRLDAVLSYIQESYREYDQSEPRYLVPLVWSMYGGEPHCWWARLVNDPPMDIAEVNHLSVTGLKNTGKDSLLLMMCLALAKQHTPEEVEFWVIDGKGDLILLSLLQATKVCAITEDQIPDAFEQINAERKRRQGIINRWGLEHKRVYKWETLPADIRRQENMSALAIVVVSEILLLQGVFKTKSEFDQRITEIMVACRSAGMRVFLSGQKFNNMGTAWRTQVDLWISSAQGLASDDEPNLGVGTEFIRSTGAIPPSQLDPVNHKGVFTIINGKVGVTGRASFLSGDEITRIIESLPTREVVRILTTPEEKPKDADEIARAVEYIKANPGKKQYEYEQELFQSTGGKAWRIVYNALQQIKDGV